MRALRPLLAILGALGLAVAPLGCGASASSLCRAACDCTGCTDAQLDECVDDLEDELKEAEEQGCGQQAEDILDCWEAELECVGDDVRVDGCDAEEEAYDDCDDGRRSPGGVVVPTNPCEQLALEAEAGGCSSGDDGGSGECSGDVERAARCYLENTQDVCAPTSEELEAMGDCVEG